jgi:hypothetical protein
VIGTITTQRRLLSSSLGVHIIVFFYFVLCPSLNFSSAMVFSERDFRDWERQRGKIFCATVCTCDGGWPIGWKGRLNCPKDKSQISIEIVQSSTLHWVK